MVKALTQKEIDRLAEQGRAELERERGEAPLPIVRNLGLTLGLAGEPDVLEWHGRAYEVPPIPHEVGAELLDIQVRLAGMAKRPDAEVTEFRALMSRATRDLYPRLIRRRFRRLRPNPFKGATIQEVGWLLGFFSACQMKPQSGTPYRSTEVRRRS